MPSKADRNPQPIEAVAYPVASCLHCGRIIRIGWDRGRWTVPDWYLTYETSPSETWTRWQLAQEIDNHTIALEHACPIE